MALPRPGARKGECFAGTLLKVISDEHPGLGFQNEDQRQHVGG